MEMDWSESRYEQREERDDRVDSPNRGKDRKKSSRVEEKDHRSNERERLRRSGGDDVSKERRKDDRDEREKDRSRDNKAREKDHDREKNREKERERDRDRKDRLKEKDREKERDVEKDGERGRDKERGKEKDKDRDKEREKEKEKEKERDRARDKEKERERERHKEKDKGKEKSKEKERDADHDKEKSRDRGSRKNIEEDYDWRKDDRKDGKAKLDNDSKKDRDVNQDEVPHHSESGQTADGLANKAHPTTLELEERILKMKEERTTKKSEDSSDMLSWVNKIRKIEAKRNAVKEKALHMSMRLEEQDNFVQGESDDEETAQHHNLAGVKVLHGIDKVMEGGAVVLTLKDQNILADGDINEEIDMLENVEIGEQKRRDDAYKAAKKKAGTYDDKFNDDPYSEKRILPQYDDPNTDEGIALDERGRIAGEAEKRLEELRKRLNGASSNRGVEDLNLPGNISSDYYTPEEMLQFKRPKKKKALRKKDKLDIDALEAEAISAGLGVGDLGTRSNAKQQALREEQDRAEAERRDKAYQTAYAKADEASKALRNEQTLPVKREEEEDIVFADDADDLYKSLERARKIALKKKEEEAPYGPDAVARLAATIASSQTVDEQSTESQGIVFTEMEEFVRSLQLREEAQNDDAEDVFMDEDEEPKVSVEEEVKDESSGWTEVKDSDINENPSNEPEEEIVPDEIIHEVAVGKGLSGALKLLQDRGTLKETVDCGGRNMDKKKSKLVGIVDDDDPKKTKQTRQKKGLKDFVYQEKDINIERTDEFGRTLTPKEAFRILSHKFHGKGPGKMKQEKRMKQFQEELKLKQMKSSDTPSMSVERMRDAQAQLKTPYLVLSGHIKPGQTSDPSSGYATVEKDLPGGLTPMLGDRKVEHFLGIKRKPEPSNLGPSKKPKP